MTAWGGAESRTPFQRPALDASWLGSHPGFHYKARTLPSVAIASGGVPLASSAPSFFNRESFRG